MPDHVRHDGIISRQLSMMPVEPSDRCFIEKKRRALDLGMKDEA
jgi:hypothetical protein